MLQRPSTLNPAFRDVIMAPGEQIDIVQPIMDQQQTYDVLGIHHYSWATSFETPPSLRADPVTKFLGPSATFHVLQATPDGANSVPRPSQAHGIYPEEWPRSNLLRPGDVSVLRDQSLEYVRALGKAASLSDYRELYYRVVSHIHPVTVPTGTSLIIGRSGAFGENLRRYNRISGIHAELSVSESGTIALKSHGRYGTLATYNPAT